MNPNPGFSGVLKWEFVPKLRQLKPGKKGAVAEKLIDTCECVALIDIAICRIESWM